MAHRPPPGVIWPPDRLTVVYDDNCELCRRCRHWLATQPTVVELNFLPTSHPDVVATYGHLPWYQIELMVVTAEGVAWVGPEAFVMCLWATAKWRSASYRMSGGLLRPMIERFFHTLSSNRSVVSGMLTPHRCESDTCTPTAPAAHASR